MLWVVIVCVLHNVSRDHAPAIGQRERLGSIKEQKLGNIPVVGIVKVYCCLIVIVTMIKEVSYQANTIYSSFVDVDVTFCA